MREAINSGDNSIVEIAFEDRGIKLNGKGLNKIIVSQDDAPIPDMAIDVLLEQNEISIDEKRITSISNLYKVETHRDLKLF